MTMFGKLAALMLAGLLLANPAFGQEEGSEEKSETAQQEGATEAAEATAADEESTSTQEEETVADQESTDEEPTAVTSFDDLLAKYQDLSTKLDEVKRKFDEADTPEASTSFRDEYALLVDQTNLVVEEIRAAGVSMLGETPKDEQLLSTMTGLVINDAFFDRDTEALALGQKLIEAGIDTAFFERAAEADRLSPSGKEILRELVLRSKESAADDLPRVKLTTSRGDIVLELFENDAPETVGNFISLVKSGFYDGIKFHRVIEGFMAQGGCPDADGTGGPGYNILCECYKPQYRRHFTGSLSMAKGTPRHSGGSQFFMTFRRTSELDGKHTVFGRVVEGMDAVNSITRIDPEVPNPNITADTIEKAEVLRDRGHEYKPRKVGG